MRDFIQILNEYEAKFNQPITIPFYLPADKTEEDFFAELEQCIKQNKRFNYKKFGFDASHGNII